MPNVRRGSLIESLLFRDAVIAAAAGGTARRVSRAAIHEHLRRVGANELVVTEVVGAEDSARSPGAGGRVPRPRASPLKPRFAGTDGNQYTSSY